MNISYNNNNNNRRFLVIMIFLMIVFAVIFLLAFIGLQTNSALFELEGIPVEIENWIIMILSLGSIIKIIFEIININNKQNI